MERSLHDGTQARLVTLAMNAGLAKEKLAEGADPAAAVPLLDRVHVLAKESIAEVRDLARGIHPAGLDDGLDTALRTLAAHSTVPVRVATGIEARPTPAVETIAYLCAAELLTNAVKHSGAGRIEIDVRAGRGRLRLAVADDGRGGARPGGGTGLPGLAERARPVDGTMTIDSPSGGGTTVTIELPLSAEDAL
ncbi:sensor histidine kinase [Tomitella cavernea]|uniref:sensor histidine kinase n=1 Tax=Tomitella cavernea TaxID=1387982 RepID=UPI0031E70E54